MEDEILNIEYHICRMTLKALNSSLSYNEAALKLGITERTLHRYKKNFGIKYDKKGDVFYIPSTRTQILQIDSNIFKPFI